MSILMAPQKMQSKMEEAESLSNTQKEMKKKSLQQQDYSPLIIKQKQ